MRLFAKTKIDKTLSQIEDQAKKEGRDYHQELGKLLPVRPLKTGVDMYKGYLFDEYSCPVCHRPVGDEILTFAYCPSCGQRIGEYDI
jgi:hypothetical protein